MKRKLAGDKEGGAPPEEPVEADYVRRSSKEGDTLGGLGLGLEPDQTSEGSEEAGKAANRAPFANEGIWTGFNKYIFSLVSPNSNFF